MNASSNVPPSYGAGSQRVPPQRQSPPPPPPHRRHHRCHLQENAAMSRLSVSRLFVSRACLGKLIVFGMYRIAPKSGRFLYAPVISPCVCPNKCPDSAASDDAVRCLGCMLYTCSVYSHRRVSKSAPRFGNDHPVRISGLKAAAVLVRPPGFGPQRHGIYMFLAVYTRNGHLEMIMHR